MLPLEIPNEHRLICFSKKKSQFDLYNCFWINDQIYNLKHRFGEKHLEPKKYRTNQTNRRDDVSWRIIFVRKLLNNRLSNFSCFLFHGNTEHTHKQKWMLLFWRTSMRVRTASAMWMLFFFICIYYILYSLCDCVGLLTKSLQTWAHRLSQSEWKPSHCWRSPIYFLLFLLIGFSLLILFISLCRLSHHKMLQLSRYLVPSRNFFDFSLSLFIFVFHSSFYLSLSLHAQHLYCCLVWK